MWWSELLFSLLLTLNLYQFSQQFVDLASFVGASILDTLVSDEEASAEQSEWVFL